MHHLRLELLQHFQEDAIVVEFEVLEFGIAGHRGVAEGAIERKPAVQVLVPLLRAQPVARGQNKNRMPAQAERFGHGLAMVVKGAGMMRRIQVWQKEYFYD